VDQDKVLIAGGGIGGLAAALALAQKGIGSLVLEKAGQLGEIGAGIQLGPNAFHCFDRLGVGEAARSMAVYIDTLRLMARSPISISARRSARASAILMPWSIAATSMACC
jgi:salicylate hydroxylase